MSGPAGELVQRSVRVRGVVPGGEFRPLVYALAGEFGLSGTVRDDENGVVAEIQGQARDVDDFCRRLAADTARSLTRHEVSWQEAPPGPVPDGSAAGDGLVPGTAAVNGLVPGADEHGLALVPTDVATCPACLAELRDPASRRHRYPFVSCTACGPRYTIVTELPYSRTGTTMTAFEPCADCRAEAEDPEGRRYRSQAVSCPACGPTLEFVEAGRAGARAPVEGEEALVRARGMVRGGAILAVKGLGGYHLVCDATNSAAVRRLRERRAGGDRPFAVLVADLDTARALAEMDEAEAWAVSSGRRPIVLVRRRTRLADSAPRLAAEVSPGISDLGIALPSTALQHLLLGLPGDPPGPAALILTSGNRSGEPVVTDDEAAVERLTGVADAWLRHNRPIRLACDDSVVRIVEGEEIVLRRSRGYAPTPVPLPVPVRPVLAVGGDVKNAFGLACGRYAWLSPHVGDMDHGAVQRTFESAVEHLSGLVAVRPESLVADRHPGYRSAQWAVREVVKRLSSGGTRLPLARVQHHHAHIAAVMAEHRLNGRHPVIGFAFDGAGYGEDGAIWGGEVLLADYDGFHRFAHLGYVPMPGTDSVGVRPYRMALTHLAEAGLPWDARLAPVTFCPRQEAEILAEQLENGLLATRTSSIGRLFDAVASLTGVCQVSGYEAQAPMELEALARIGMGENQGFYDLPLVPGQAGQPRVWDVGQLIGAVADDVVAGIAPMIIAVRFHRTLARAVVAAAEVARQETRVHTVVLAGGVFANQLLLSLARTGLRAAGFEVLIARRVPSNDGGLALGQIVVGARASGGTTESDGTPTPG